MGDPDYLVGVIEESVIPAYRKLKVFLEEEYKPHARKYPGIYGLPDAEKVYSDLIYRHTSVHYTASELHQIGLSEVSRILSEMDLLRSQILPDGTLSDLRSSLQNPFLESSLKVLGGFKDVFLG
ncbi:hypothetical protein HK102_010935, partial [Quaeritorhiza haematococci]